MSHHIFLPFRPCLPCSPPLLLHLSTPLGVIFHASLRENDRFPPFNFPSLIHIQIFIILRISTLNYTISCHKSNFLVAFAICFHTLLHDFLRPFTRKAQSNPLFLFPALVHHIQFSCFHHIVSFMFITYFFCAYFFLHTASVPFVFHTHATSFFTPDAIKLIRFSNSSIHPYLYMTTYTCI